MNNCQFENKQLQEKALTVYSSSSKEIENFVFEGETYWLKKARKTSSNLFHKLCYKLFSYKILVPVSTKQGKDAVLFESNKLKAFDNEGLFVPKVVGVCDDFFLMSDTGIPVYTCLKKKNIESKEFYYFLDKIIEVLSNIHAKGLYHGGAQTRNFTYKDGVISAIDFEESFDESVDVKSLQLRDLMLLLLSMTKVDNFEVNYTYIIEKYVKHSSNYEFKRELKSMSEDLNFLIGLNNIDFIHNILPRDAKGFCNLMVELKKLVID